MKKLLLAAAVLVIAMAACNEKQRLYHWLMGNAYRRTAGKNAGYQTGRGRGCIFH